MRAAAPRVSPRKTSGKKGASRPRAALDSSVQVSAAHSSLPLGRIVRGDCEAVLRELPDACVDLIVTSPPYADARASTYGGVAPDGYVAWFLPKAEQFRRVLKPEGTFILNVKERVVDGERHPYVLELILALRAQGWLWSEEFIWHKKNCYPGKWPNRFRDAWERCLQFNKQRRFRMFQDAVRVPMGNWATSRLRNLSPTDRVRDPSRVGSGFGKNVSNWLGRELAYPTNVLHLATECANKNHSAAFPLALPDFFIRLFTQEQDLVLDPFMGSGTTALAARAQQRHWLGVESDPEIARMAENELRK